jgi:hypothetical protein
MRARRFVIAVGAAVSALALLVGAAGPAGAVGSFGPTVLVGPSGCHDIQTTTSSSGVTYGFMTCPGPTRERLVYLTGRGAALRTVATGYYGKVLGVADDGVATFVLYAVESSGEVAVVRRTHAGSMRKSLLSDGRDSFGGFFDGSIAAAGGRFWAAWSYVNGAETVGRVVTYQTLTPALPRQLPTIRGRWPSVTLYQDRVFMVSSTSGLGSGGAIARSIARDNGSWSTAVLSDPTETMGRFAPYVVRTGSVVRVAWTEKSGPVGTSPRLVYTDQSSGRWVRTVLPGNAFEILPVRIELSGANLFVAWSGYTLSASGRVRFSNIRVAQRTSGRWTSTAFTDGSQAPSLLDLAAANGKATVFMLREAANWQITARTQR